MHDKFIFSFVHRVYYLLFIVFVFVFVSYIYLYVNYPTYQEALQKFFLERAIHNNNSHADNVIEEMVKHEDDFLAQNIRDNRLRTHNEHLLELMHHESVASIFVVFFKEDKLYFLMDGSHTDKTEPLQFFVPEDMGIFTQMEHTKKKEIFIQKEVKTLGFTLVKPIIERDKVVAFLLIDYSQKEMDKYVDKIDNIVHTAIFVLSLLMFLSALWAIVMGMGLYQKYKMYRIPRTKAYLRSFLTDHYERINFLDYYIALVDIDAFKRINDLYGEEKGNHVIKKVLQKISFLLSKRDILIQYGGEEFLLLVHKECTGVETFKQQMESIRRNVEALTLPLNGEIEHVTVSIGTLINSESACSLQTAIHNADTALYFAKHNGRNRVCDFDLSDDKRTYREKLKEMIESEQLVCHYQPIVNLYTGEVHHYEALLRIEDEEGIIYPDKILPDLEDSYFYSRMSMKVIEYNVAKLRSASGFILSINLSSDDLLNDTIIDLLMEHADVADRMMVEILETKDVDYQSVESVIRKLKEQGYKICIDDFGTGYANFEHLFNLSIDYLKLDGSLIRNLHTDRRAHSIIRAIVVFCQQQKIQVVAEFVENKQIVEVLKGLGIKYGQGYYFAKPKPFEALMLEEASYSSSTL